MPQVPCKLSTKKPYSNGYVYVWFEGRNVRLHRLVFYRAHGWWPPVVMHTCDTPICEEPAHLVAGTHQSNVADRQTKLRQARGESQGLAKLTERQVLDIRNRHAAGESYRALASAFGTNFSNIALIVKRKTWSHV